MAREGRNVLVQLLLRDSLSPDWFASAGNRVVTFPEALGALRQSLASEGASPDLLKSHAIPDEAHQALAEERFDDFARLRTEFLNHEEEAFIEAILSRHEGFRDTAER